MKPFITDARDIPLESIRSEFTCMMRFDQAKWEHFYMFKDRVLFDLMNNNCDTIFMVTLQIIDYNPIEVLILLLSTFHVEFKPNVCALVIRQNCIW